MIDHTALLDPTAGASVVIRTTVLIVGTGLASHTLQAMGRSAASRHLVWLTTIGALLALPLLWALLPALRIAVLPALGASARYAIRSGTVQEGMAVSTAWMGLAFAVYAGGVLALLTQVCAARWALAGLWRAAVPCVGEGWGDALADAQRRMAVTTRVALRFAPTNCTPMTWGLLAPRILLPPDARSWGREELRMVLMHELAHVSRHDSAARLAASLACAIHWIHPGVWFAAWRLRVEQERAADDLVLCAGAAPLNYARTLLEFAHRKALAGAGAHAAAMTGASELEARLLSIVGARRRNPPSPRFAAVAATIVAATTLLVAVTAPVRAQLTTNKLESRPPSQPPLGAGARAAGRTPIPAVASRRAAHRPPVAAADRAGDTPGTRLAATSPIRPIPAVEPIPAVPAAPAAPSTPSAPPTLARVAAPPDPPSDPSPRL